MFDELGTEAWHVVKVYLRDSERDIQYESLDAEGKPIAYERNDTPTPPTNNTIQKPLSK